MKLSFKLDKEDKKMIALSVFIFSVLTLGAFNYHVVAGIIVGVWSVVSMSVGFGYVVFVDGCKFDDHND